MYVLVWVCSASCVFLFVPVCCSMLQCVVVCCSVWQCVAVRCSALWCGVLRCVAALVIITNKEII